VFSLKSGLRVSTVLAALIFVVACPATAQTTGAQTTDNGDSSAAAAPQQDKTAKDTATTTVVVKGEKPQNRIDRQVYDNTKNIDSATGTATDALNKVPSVNVDPNGNVTLRGNANVKIYVDGKPSAMMSGDNRAGALQSMSSNDIGSIEVMTNPGAQFSSEGTGGIINLVMKKNRRPGGSGVLTANLGTRSSYNGGFTGSYNAGKLGLSGGINLRHDSRPSRGGSSLEQRDTSGQVVAGTGESDASTTSFDNMSANGAVTYNARETDTLGVQLNYAKRSINADTRSRYVGYDANGNAVSDYVRKASMKGPHEDVQLDLNWDHTGQAPGEDLKTDLRLSRSDGASTTDEINSYSLPVVTQLTDTRRQSNDLKSAVLSIDYTRFLGKDQIAAGIQVTHDDNDFINTASGTGTSALNSHFAYSQTLSAAYVTYQKPIGDKWIVMGGLRAENLDLKTDEMTSGTRSHIDYTKLSPSAFATYSLSDAAKIRFSYSHRLQRPSAQDLNPFLTYVDAQNYTAGNPQLKPQESDAFELGYEVTAKSTSYQTRAFYRKDANVITSYSHFINDPAGTANQVLLTTRQNEGSGDAGGLEFNINTRLGQALNLNANATFTHTDLKTPAIDGTQSADSLSGRFMADYTITPKDRLQFMYFTSGKTLTGQGYRSPFMMGNLSYRHNFTAKAALVATVSDPFRSMKFKTVTNTGLAYSEQTRSFAGPVVYIGLSYMLGGPSSAATDNPWGLPPRAGGNPPPGGRP